jgi:hypothetical protein
MPETACIHATVSSDAVRRIATEWCRQMASVEPGGFARIVAADAAVHGLGVHGDVLRGAAAVEDYFAKLKRLCSTTSCEVRASVVQGERAMLRWVMRFQSGRGACDRQESQVQGMSMIVTRQLMIVEVWNTYGSPWV